MWLEILYIFYRTIYPSNWQSFATTVCLHILWSIALIDDFFSRKSDKILIFLRLNPPRSTVYATSIETKPLTKNHLLFSGSPWKCVLKRRVRNVQSLPTFYKFSASWWFRSGKVEFWIWGTEVENANCAAHENKIRIQKRYLRICFKTSCLKL